MELQKTFKEEYLRQLKEQVKAGTALPLYGNDVFDIDQTKLESLAGVYAPEGFSDRLSGLHTNDFEAAKVVYEAYENITPLMASYEAFWAYLTHTSMFEYAQKRWSDVKTGKASDKYVLDHWFFGSNGILRNTAAGLWWDVYNTIDPSRKDRYELTAILFENYTLRTVSFGTSLLIRHREAMIGILQFLKDNPKIRENSFENRGRFIAKYFNRLGAVKQLAYLDREYFTAKCESMKDKILSVTSRDQLQDETLYND